MSKHTKNILNITIGIMTMLGITLCAGFGVLPVCLTIPINFVIGLATGSAIAREFME